MYHGITIVVFEILWNIMANPYLLDMHHVIIISFFLNTVEYYG